MCNERAFNYSDPCGQSQTLDANAQAQQPRPVISLTGGKEMRSGLSRLYLALLLILLPAPLHDIEPQDPALGKYPLDPRYYKTLVEIGLLPTRPHIIDV